jgi:hypothetical protein
MTQQDMWMWIAIVSWAVTGILFALWRDEAKDRRDLLNCIRLYGKRVK